MGLLICRRSFGPSELEVSKRSRVPKVCDPRCSSAGVRRQTSSRYTTFRFYLWPLLSHCRSIAEGMPFMLFPHKTGCILDLNPGIRDLIKGYSSFITILISKFTLKIMLDICWDASEELSRWGILIKILCPQSPPGLQQRSGPTTRDAEADTFHRSQGNPHKNTLWVGKHPILLHTHRVLNEK